VSPIFVRPVREQLEHDRLIRFLQAKYNRKLDAAINVGDERVVPVKIGVGTFFPDLVLTDGKKLAGLVEVETGESVNNLEAMAQWVHFSRARVPFHLYVPVPGYDAARRLCAANGAKPSEIWTYRPTHDGFDLVRIHHDTSVAPVPTRTAPPAPAKPAVKAQAPVMPKKPAAAKPAKETKAAKSKPRPTAKAKPAAKPKKKPGKKK
jgi:cell division septation protein DedD